MGNYHCVQQGECFSSLAKKYGFVSYDRIYDHPQNAELRKMRPNPNVLYPQDMVYIPEHELREVDAVTEQRHTFQLKASKTVFRLILEDGDEKPFANVQYELRIGKKTFAGTTNGQGKLEEEIPADARTGELVLFSDEEGDLQVTDVIALNFGHIDPVEEISGVQSRLNNLGFVCGRVDGILGEKTKAALSEFQEKYGLEVTGQACSATCDKLRQIHDWK